MTTEKDVVNSSPTTISNANLPKISSKATQSNKESFYSVLAKTPYPAWAMSALCFASTPAAMMKLTGIPSLLELSAFGFIFAGAGYITSTGDITNGSGTTTAWSLSYTLFNMKRAVKSKKPLPLILVSGALANAALHGKQYFFSEPDSD
ncbi:1839_t:CDS:2 [Paraglomus brasilianum]|uniref:1839_t:CDS:1 n=1 Tax=Paraglomus brasilianum TaxID=144538 RepID=A0A9N9GFR7_9GLOM|nr:1839_t:CDS:2 [Paraglomus brasilianum]